MKPEEIWERCVPSGLDAGQIELLRVYGRWLETEAITTGVVGPGEAGRIDTRHLADSLLFAGPIADRPAKIIDLGSGAGLPGIPLAILYPDTPVVLVDRSGKRVDLLRRIVRILQLPNIQVTHAEIEHVRDRAPVVVSRATLPPDRAWSLISPLLESPGVAILGGSWTKRPEHPGWETLEITPVVLDQPVWLLIMRHT